MNLTAIIIIAILSSMVVSIVKTVQKNNKSIKHTDALLSEHESSVEQKLAAMQERIEVLEKIVTDEKYNLNKAIDELKG
jgi:uncharacterized protein YlxW (UPF0749 family)